MRPESELETLLKALHHIATVQTKKRLDRGRLIGTISMVGVLEWALGVRGDKDRDMFLRIAQEEVREAIRHADRPSGRR